MEKVESFQGELEVGVGSDSFVPCDLAMTTCVMVSSRDDHISTACHWQYVEPQVLSCSHAADDREPEPKKDVGADVAPHHKGFGKSIVHGVHDDVVHSKNEVELRLSGLWTDQYDSWEQFPINSNNYNINKNVITTD